jgi:hypothetical protein
MNHRSYNEMRGSTAVQYCRAILPVAVWGNTLAVRVVLPLWPYCGGSTSLPRLAFALVFGFVL